jgi:hypothetical protein
MARSKEKAAGSIYEQRFVLECLTRDLHPFVSIQEGLPQDFVVLSKNYTPIRVQVKGTGTPVYRSSGSTRFQIIAARGASKQPLDCTKIDFLVAHVCPDTWYIIPCPALTGVSVWLYPDTENSKGAYEKYRDRWDLLIEAEEPVLP